MIQHALDLLTHTDMTVDEISQSTGFASSNYFRTVFTKMTGKTPKEVRKQ
jgi:AraC-like DNA-binding protein